VAQNQWYRATLHVTVPWSNTSPNVKRATQNAENKVTAEIVQRHNEEMRRQLKKRSSIPGPKEAKECMQMMEKFRIYAAKYRLKVLRRIKSQSIGLYHVVSINHNIIFIMYDVSAIIPISFLFYLIFFRCFYTFYRAMHFSAFARSWDRMSSVCLSVCL